MLSDREIKDILIDLSFDGENSHLWYVIMVQVFQKMSISGKQILWTAACDHTVDQSMGPLHLKELRGPELELLSNRSKR